MSESIRAVERALDVLMCFTNQSPELSLTEISEKIGLNKSTVHRLLVTLDGKNFLERDKATGAYRPGYRFIQLAFLTKEQHALRQLVSPYLHKLCSQYNENVNLTVLDEVDVIYLEVIESPQRIKLAAAQGQRLPAFCTASGKAILAFLPDHEVTDILASGMPQYTKNTITILKAYLEDMHKTRERGFAISKQEFEDEINAVAAPICTHRVASISIAGPAYRLTLERMMKIGPDLVAVANGIAHEFELSTKQV